MQSLYKFEGMVVTHSCYIFRIQGLRYPWMLIQSSDAATPVTAIYFSASLVRVFVLHRLDAFFCLHITLFLVLFACLLLMKNATSIDGMEVSMIENVIVKVE